MFHGRSSRVNGLHQPAITSYERSSRAKQLQLIELACWRAMLSELGTQFIINDLYSKIVKSNSSKAIALSISVPSSSLSLKKILNWWLLHHFLMSQHMILESILFLTLSNAGFLLKTRALVFRQYRKAWTLHLIQVNHRLVQSNRRTGNSIINYLCTKHKSLNVM